MEYDGLAMVFARVVHRFLDGIHHLDHDVLRLDVAVVVVHDITAPQVHRHRVHLSGLPRQLRLLTAATVPEVLLRTSRTAQVLPQVRHC
jgi:hypothetical protein